MTRTSLVNLIKIPKIIDDCFLCFAQSHDTIPFDIKRVYFIINPKKGLSRGHHAHVVTKQILFCIRGKAKIILDDGHTRKSVLLAKPNIGLFLQPLIWHEIQDLTPDTILLVLASHKYMPDDYLRSYSEFKRKIKHAYAEKSSSF